MTRARAKRVVRWMFTYEIGGEIEVSGPISSYKRAVQFKREAEETSCGPIVKVVLPTPSPKKGRSK